MSYPDDLTDDQIVELEELRELTLKRFGMMSSVAKAYSEHDIDMLRAMVKLSDDPSMTTRRVFDISRAVERLRRIHYCHDVSHLASPAHIEAQHEVGVEMERMLLAKGKGQFMERAGQTDEVIDMAFHDPRRLPQFLSVIAAGNTDPKEIARIIESMADQSLTLVEGTL